MTIDEVMEQLWTEDYEYFKRLVIKRLGWRDETEVADLIMDSLEVLKKKYLDGKIVEIPERQKCRKIVVGIIKINILVFKREQALKAADSSFIGAQGQEGPDERSADDIMAGDRSNAWLEPPSVYLKRAYAKNYYNSTKEERNKWQREYYQKNIDKQRAINNSEKKKAHRRKHNLELYHQVKADPEKYAEFRNKKNEWRRKQRKLKKLGIWKDARKSENRKIKDIYKQLK